MPFNLPSKNSGAGAPQIADGLAVGRFDDLVLKAHDDWAGTDKFGHEDDGQRYHFQFTMLDPETREVLYHEGDPMTLEITTRTATGEKSNFYAAITGLLTAKELAVYDAATDDDPFDGSVMQGRIYDLKVAHNKKEWPFIDQVVGVAKSQKIVGA